MKRTLIHNIGELYTGDLAQPVSAATSLAISMPRMNNSNRSAIALCPFEGPLWLWSLVTIM